MFFIMGINTASKQIGNIPNLICPSCGAYTSMQITVLFEVLSLFFIPIFKWHRRYLATAYCCDSVFMIDPEEGKAFERGETETIDPDHMHKADNYFYARTCPHCGAELSDGARFCSMCGKPLA